MEFLEMKDLTKEQAIQIVKLIYPFEKGFKSEFKFHYQPYDEAWMDDAREFISVTFKGTVFADKVYPLKLEILPNLDCYVFYLDFDKKINQKVYYSLPSRNQHEIQKLFIKWGIKSNKNDRYKLCGASSIGRA